MLQAVNFTAFAQQKSSTENAARVVKFYPNPASSSINFELPAGYDKSYSIQLFNFMGKKVAEMNAATQRVNFSLDGLFRGVYIFQLRDKYGRIADSGKFQVIK